MSRIGNRILNIPAGVTAQTQPGNWVEIKGPLGTNRRQFNSALKIKIADQTLTVHRPQDTKSLKELHGTTNSHLQAMLVGVKTGFMKRLVISGVGYRARQEGNNLILNLGFSQPITYQIPSQIKITILKGGIIEIKGIDKQLVGQVAATIRQLRPVEPYKAKGISYQDEKIRRKVGKTAAGK